MNLNVQQIGGEVLVVSQFTLAADTQKGFTTKFLKGAAPALANELYGYFSQKCAEKVTVANGQFAADMQVSLTNDGPVTFWLKCLNKDQNRYFFKAKETLSLIALSY